MFYVWIISNRTTTCSAASHCLRPLPSCEHAALFLHNGKNITYDLPFMFSIGYFCILNRRHTHFIYCLDRIWCYEVSTMSTSSRFIVTIGSSLIGFYRSCTITVTTKGTPAWWYTYTSWSRFVWYKPKILRLNMMHLDLLTRACTTFYFQSADDPFSDLISKAPMNLLAAIISLFQTSPIHVNFEVSIIPSWVVEEWNGLESSHLDFCSENLSFWKIFKLKHSFAPQIILSDRSMCIVPHQSTVSSLLIPLLKNLCEV